MSSSVSQSARGQLPPNANEFRKATSAAVALPSSRGVPEGGLNAERWLPAASCVGFLSTAITVTTGWIAQSAILVTLITLPQLLQS